MPFNIGETIGSYRLLEQLGQGGMATVFKAYHAALDRYVAIKVLHPAFTEDPNFLARFQREAKVVARLEHPNIVPIYDFAEHGGRPYLVLKYVEGETLKARMARGPLSMGEMLAVIDAVGGALAYAHQQGILHRDVKPSNVMLSRDGQIYLADFGLARIASAGESTLSSDMMLGTPQYISPEQALGKRDLDEGTDIYSFGVMLYELLVGKVPFSADTPYAIIHDHIYSPLPLPRLANPRLPEAVERVLLKTLSKERPDRYPTIMALLGALKEALSSPVAAEPLPAALDGATRVSPSPSASASAPRAAPSSAATRLAPAGVRLAVEVSAPEGQPPAAAPAKKKRKLWLLFAIPLALLLCFFVLVAVNNARNNRAQEQTDAEATQPALAAEMEARLQAARQRVEQSPQDPFAHLELALALYDAGLGAEAGAAAEAAIAAAGENVDFFIAAGKEMRQRELWVPAAKSFLHAYQLTASPPLELADLTHESLYKAMRSPQGVEEIDLSDYRNLDQPMTGVAQALAQLTSGDPAQAEVRVRAVLREFPGFAEARLCQAEIFLRQERMLLARPLLEELSQDPALPLWVRDESARMLNVP